MEDKFSVFGVAVTFREVAVMHAAEDAAAIAGDDDPAQFNLDGILIQRAFRLPLRAEWCVPV